MGLPRTLITNHPLGRPIGPANQPRRHADVVAAALDLVQSTASGAVVATMPGGFEP